MLIYKLPLIVIVASPKWHSEWAVWPREFQICGYFGPPAYRSRDTAHAVNFWPLTWANASLRLYITLTVVTMDHQ